MDGTRFAAITRTLTAFADRRTPVRALSGAAIGASSLSPDADAKNKEEKSPTVTCGEKCRAQGSVCASEANFNETALPKNRFV